MAAAAAAKIAQQQQDTQGSEMIAQNYTKESERLESQGQINSPSKSFHQGGGLEINGKSVKENPNKPVAPVAKIQFKVIEYGAVSYDKPSMGLRNGINDNTRESQTSIHYDLMDQNAYARDSEQNRNINMDELHELLGS